MSVVGQLKLGLMLSSAVLPGPVTAHGPDAVTLSGSDLLLAQAQQRPFDSRPASGPPTPAPRSSSGGAVVLPRVPYDNRLDAQRPYYRQGLRRRGPESQRVVPGSPGAPEDPVWYLDRYLDRPGQRRVECEWIRRLALRTDRAYWRDRLKGCLGG